ncbi:hypothetical protein [Nocardiopsis lambiniae]|uniref:Uncharacterized protein n=1 Tax=Nocardiopsis lambiniae TaxID=3075539 RepID=A0ABU2MC46_9ACTN|nr:hypothetical protein [Nocardiopsis sp. DSM 44743]MDT0330248.1 hypothetical protein [Nocardiopsis sp. DSM 44743]
MTFEERRVWIYTAIALIIPVIYTAIIATRLTDTPPEHITYTRPLLIAIGTALAANLLLTVIAGALWPRDAHLRDERDTEIDRRGLRWEFIALAIGAAAALALTLTRADHFWIAHTLYLGFVLSALTSSAARIIAYRRGM